MQHSRRLLQRSISWVKCARFCCLTPHSTFLFLLLLGVLFRRAFLSEIDQKLAAVRFDQFVRGERIHERPDPSISYPINYQPFDVHLSDAIDPRDQAKRNCDPIPLPHRIVHDPQHASYPRRRFPSSVTPLSPSSSPFCDRFTPYPMHRHSSPPSIS